MTKLVFVFCVILGRPGAFGVVEGVDAVDVSEYLPRFPSTITRNLQINDDEKDYGDDDIHPQVR